MLQLLDPVSEQSPRHGACTLFTVALWLHYTTYSNSALTASNFTDLPGKLHFLKVRLPDLEEASALLSVTKPIATDFIIMEWRVGLASPNPLGLSASPFPRHLLLLRSWIQCQFENLNARPLPVAVMRRVFQSLGAEKFHFAALPETGTFRHTLHVGLICPRCSFGSSLHLTSR